LPQDVELVLFRVLQEGLTNIHRHAASTQAKIRLHIDDDRVSLSIEDNGKGLSPTNGHGKTGVGIASMRERVRELGGDFRISSVPGRTKVEAVVPIAPVAGS
jgi:signal transduction histidine kinase